MGNELDNMLRLADLEYKIPILKKTAKETPYSYENLVRIAILGSFRIIGKGEAIKLLRILAKND